MELWNLQLIVHKQEEELRMYRNGTTSSELFELIREKDIEIETWKAKLQEKDDKLRRLAKTSGDVMLKYERLEDDLQAVHDAKHKLEDDVKRALEQKHTAEQRVRAQEEEVAAARKELAARDEVIGSLRLQLWEAQQSNEAQVAAANEVQISLLEASTEVRQLKDYQRDLEAVIADSAEEIGMLTAEAKKWKSFVTDQDSSIEKLQKRCAALVADKTETLRNLDVERQEMITHVQAFRESMSSNLAQRDEALKKREDKIRELQFTVSVLQQEIKVKTAAAAATVADKEQGGRRVLGERTNTMPAASGQGQQMMMKKPSVTLNIPSDPIPATAV